MRNRCTSNLMLVIYTKLHFPCIEKRQDAFFMCYQLQRNDKKLFLTRYIENYVNGHTIFLQQFYQFLSNVNVITETKHTSVMLQYLYFKILLDMNF